jgi:cobalt-zinc-cadmium efflux system outer membrane protein
MVMVEGWPLQERIPGNPPDVPVKRMKNSLLALMTVMLGVSCNAQDRLSLADAMQTALAHRSELRAMTARVESAQDLQRQARLIPNPRFFFQTENLRTSHFDFGRDADTFLYGSQVIETSGRRHARVEVAKSQAAFSELAVRQTRRDILKRVREVYWNALAAEKIGELLQENAAYFQQVVDYQEARLKEGRAAEVDVLRVRLEGQRLRAAVENAQLDSDKSQLTLAQELGMANHKPWVLSEEFEALESPKTIEADVAHSRIEGQLAYAAVEQSRSNLIFERAAGKPDLDALFGYKRTTGLNTGFAGLQFNIPLFNRNQGAASAAQASVRAAEENLRATQVVLESELAIAKREYEAVRRQIESSLRPMRDQALQISEISRAAYKEGGLDLLRLIDAEQVRVDAQLTLLRALNEYHRAVAGLELAEGVEQ